MTGNIFPTIANLHFAPFTDESLYIEQSCKANFWLVYHTVVKLLNDKCNMYTF